MDWLLANRPVLIGLHLGFAIIGIDGFLWLLGELFASEVNARRARLAGMIGLVGFVGSWLLGGYYYLHYYGTLVKPEILAGSAPWAHAVAMEAKEHIFLFLVPMAIAVMASLFATPDLASIKHSLRRVIAAMVVIAFTIGAMGYIISAAARWATT